MTVPTARRRSDAIAVVGIGCRFAPSAAGPQGLWANLCDGVDAVGPIPEDRWERGAYYDPNPAKPGKMDVDRGAFLDQSLEELDAAFFGIAPVEAAQLDPQQRLLLEVAWESLEDAGLQMHSLRGSDTGVFVGAFTLDNMIERAGASAREDIRAQTALTCTHTVLSSRLAYVFDLRGPCMTIDTACSSSLVAVHQACRALADEACDMALAGGVSRIFRPETYLMMAKGGFLAPDGRSKSFSRNGDGYGRGEGCGVVVLKRLEDALRAGDRIYAVVEGTGVNQDGRTGGMAVPSVHSQARLMEAVARRAAIDPAAVQYVEAHGTGTFVGDPIEMASIGGFYGRAPGRIEPCVVGSLKAGLGHTEGAAGVAGFVKAALVAHHGLIPRQAWLDELNPHIDFDGLGLRVAVTTTDLTPEPSGCLVAVNSFGYGGTNAHAVLRSTTREETAARPRAEPVDDGIDGLGPVVLLSGHSDNAVTAMATDYADGLRRADGDEGRRRLLAAFAARSAHVHRMAVVGDPARFVDVLEEVGAGGSHPDAVVGRADRLGLVEPAFVFSGMGPQWWGMARGLMESSAVVRSAVRRCDEVFRRLSGWSIADAMLADEHRSRMASTEVAQPASVVLQIGLVELLATFGVRPSAALGHSVGEVAAGYAAGAIDLGSAVRIAYHRSRLQASTAGTGSMLATGLSEADAGEIVDRHGPGVSIAAVNAPDATTLAGDSRLLERIQGELAERGTFCRALRVEVPYHSPAMDPILDELRDVLGDLPARPPEIPLYSSVSEADDGGIWDASYWARNVRAPVAFHAAAQRLVGAGHRVLLEVGAHPVLAMSLQPLLSGPRAGAVVTTLRRDRDDPAAMRDALVELWLRGVPVDWTRVLGTGPPGGLPLYPWQRERHWQESDSVRRERTGQATGSDLFQGRLVTRSPDVVDVDLSDTRIPWLRDHLVAETPVLPAAAFVETMVSRARSVADGALPIFLEDVEIEAPLVLARDADTVLRVTRVESDRLVLAARHAGEDDAWRAHATARIGGAAHGGVGSTVVVGDGESVDVNAVYAALRSLGLDHRGEFRSMVGVSRGEDGVRIEVARVGSSGEGEGEGGSCTVNPPSLDAVFQGMLAVGPLDEATLHLPVRIGRVVVLEDLPERFTAHVVLRRRSQRRIVADADLLDTEGRLVAVLREVTLHRAPPVATDVDRWLDRITYEVAWRPFEIADPPPVPSRAFRWHAVGPSAAALAALVRGEDGPGRRVVEYGPDDARELDLQPGDALVLEVDGEGHDRIDREVGRLLEILAGLDTHGALPTTLVLLTHHAVAALPSDAVTGWTGSWAVGMRRVMANELDHIRARLIDHDGIESPALRAALLHTDAEEVAVRDGELYAPEIERRPESSRARTWWDVVSSVPVADAEGFALSQRSPSVDGLVWVADARRAPQDGEVELRVEAVGLNHKDLVKLLGAFPDHMADRTFTGIDAGMEQCVVVERVGRGVDHLAPGDRFLASIPDGFRRHVTVRPDQVRLAPCPVEWTPTQAAGQLVALSTAHRAVVELGRLGAGDTLLVHGAAGAFGAAAIGVGRAMGARVLATASTAERRGVARARGASECFDSRSLAFVDEVRAVTRGRGVDVALNTLAGEDGLRANLAVTVDGGCVVEIGKRSMGRGDRIPLDLFDRNISYVSFDLDHLVRDQRAFDRLASTVLAEVGRGTYRPIPVTAIPLASLAAGFRSMSRSEHTGKLVLDMGEVAGVRCAEPPPRPPRIRGNASYVVSGGTGGVGVEIARWLVARGARRIALLGRRGRLSAEARTTVADLEAAGAEIEVASVDVTEASAVATFLARWRCPRRPVRGVVHAAGVAHDVPLARLVASDVRDVVDPKVVGAVALHLATIEDPLDLFLVTSSVSSWTGTTGQAAYSAANAALEGFTQWRRRSGRPSTCVALGPVAEIGMAALTEEVAKYVHALGFSPLPPARLDVVLDRVLEWNRPALGLFDLSWGQWSLAEPGAASEVRVRDLVREGRSASGPDGSSARALLASLPLAERKSAVAQLVVGELETVVGMGRGELGVDDGLLGLGLDSLMLVELQTRLNGTLGTSLSVMRLLSHNTARDIAEEIASDIG